MASYLKVCLTLPMLVNLSETHYRHKEGTHKGSVAQILHWIALQCALYYKFSRSVSFYAVCSYERH